MVHIVTDKDFSLFLKTLKIFLNLRLSLIVPLRRIVYNLLKNFINRRKNVHWVENVLI